MFSHHSNSFGFWEVIFISEKCGRPKSNVRLQKASFGVVVTIHELEVSLDFCVTWMQVMSRFSCKPLNCSSLVLGGDPRVCSTEESNPPKKELDNETWCYSCSEIPLLLWLVPCCHLAANETISEFSWQPLWPTISSFTKLCFFFFSSLPLTQLQQMKQKQQISLSFPEGHYFYGEAVYFQTLLRNKRSQSLGFCARDPMSYRWDGLGEPPTPS